jgi:tRNA A37 methylthiotransferase MiaB|tara:strand:- start:245 stop:592 length:348 start_codon:yes stop_codon:yes gene_type:complete
VKKKRLAEIIALQRSEALQVNLRNEVGATRLVLIEGFSKKSNHELSGRTCANKKVVIHAAVAKAMYEPNDGSNSNLLIPLRIGDYVAVTITNANASTLFAQPLGRTTVTEFYARG